MIPVTYDLLALGAGLLLPLAFAPFDYSFFAVLSLLLLFLGWLDATPLRAWVRGYLFGLGQFGFGISWVFVSIHEYGGAGVVVAVGLTTLFVAWWALYPALAGWLALRWFRGGRAFRAITVFPAVWVLVEWFRGWFVTGFPWLHLGYSQLDTPLAGLAPVFGTYGVSWAVALLAGLLLAAVQWRGGRRRLAFIAVLALLGVTHALHRIEWTQAAGAPFQAALLQGNIPQDQKWQPDFQRETLRRYWQMSREQEQARVVVWPETAVPAYYHQLQDTVLADLQEEVMQRGSDLLIGIPVYEGEHYYNALIALGSAPGMYFKRHLVPFGEYMPLRPLLGWVLDLVRIPMADFSAGRDDQPLLSAAGHPLAASVCFEDVFGNESRTFLPQARYLVNVTNDAWFGDSIAPHQHAQMARMRALESGRYMLRATNTGVSAIITPKGTYAVRAPMLRQAAVTGNIVPMQGRTPYVGWGDLPVLAMLLLVAGWSFCRGRRDW